jgi:hypothetical protein
MKRARKAKRWREMGMKMEKSFVRKDSAAPML